MVRPLCMRIVTLLSVHGKGYNVLYIGNTAAS